MSADFLRVKSDQNRLDSGQSSLGFEPAILSVKVQRTLPLFLDQDCVSIAHLLCI